MKSSIFLAVGASLAFFLSDTLALEKRDNPGVVAFPLQRVLGTPASQKLRRHKRSFEAILNNQGLVWTLQLLLGTPPQKVQVQLDTGSSDLLVETDSSTFCKTQPSVCSGQGTYDANSSSTYVYLNSDLDASFDNGEDAQGDYASDVLSIDSTIVLGMEFGIMYTTTVTKGLLGVSFPAIESIAVHGGSPYNNLPILLVNEGYIQSAAFSVWLNNDQSAAGVVLFGGVDTDKFYGNLVTLPFVEGPGDFQVQQFFVTLQGVQMTGVNGNPNPTTLTGGSTPGPALLDTGTTFILLPDAVAEAIQSQLGAVVTNDLPYVECSLASSSITVDFIFTGITINVPLSQLIDPNPGQTECILRLVSSSEETVLGDPFLSSTYVVFDLGNKEAHIAQAVFGATSENIVPIGSGPNAVPNASGQPTTTISTSMISSSSSTTSTSSISSSTSTSSLSLANSSSLNILAASTSSPILITLTTSMTSTTCITSDTSTLTASAEPTHCNHDNCYRAMLRASATSFCSGYLTGSTYPAVPSDILNKCSTSASRISSGCGCLMTGG